MSDFFTAFSLIALAELGDKTQMLALAFSSKHSIRTILLGVGLGIFVNHGLAILLATTLAQILSVSSIRLFSAFLFLFFGIMSLRLEEDKLSIKESKHRVNPILTIAFAFFFGELGDKSQLSAMALGGQSSFPIMVLFGTSLAMLFVSAIGLVVGKLLGKKLPRVTLQWLSALLFLFFGLQGLYLHLPPVWRPTWAVVLFFFAFFGMIFGILADNKHRKQEALSSHLSLLLQRCKECPVHKSDCSVALAIDEATQEYLGQHLPYLGNVILFLESMKIKASDKSASLKKHWKNYASH